MQKTLTTGETITVTGHAAGIDLDKVQVESEIGERGILTPLREPVIKGNLTVVARAGGLGLTADDVEVLKGEAAADKARIFAVRNDPANVARREVDALFDRAAARSDYPGEYFPLLRHAQAALAAWREQYPEAAAGEDRQTLLARADDIERKAEEALWYDADGSLTRDMQQERHNEWMAEAQALRQQARKLR